MLTPLLCLIIVFCNVNQFTIVFVFKECKCDPNGSLRSACDENGLCSCKTNVMGDKCNVCIPQYWGVFTGETVNIAFEFIDKLLNRIESLEIKFEQEA